jgi:ligand-binding sensor domain-containing protein
MFASRIKFVLLKLLLFICCVNINSQYLFRHLDIVDGLSDNQLRDVTLMPDGRMAIRTMTMLNIYNGATFERIYQDRRKDYKWNFNRFLKERYAFKEYCDVEGRIWMKAPDYLSLFDPNNNRFIYDIDSVLKSFGINGKLKNLFIDNSKNYWFLTGDNQFFIYDISKKELITVSDGNDAFIQQYGIPYELVQYKNLYWIMYSSGLLRCWDITSREFIMQDTYFIGKISGASNFLCIHPTSTGDLWLMYNNAVSFYNRTNHTWKEIATIYGSSNFFTCLDLDKDGNAWVGTSWSGLRRIDAQTHEVEIISGLKLNSGGILENDIECVFVDDDNGLWVGTLWQGLCYYHPNMKKFKLIQTIQKETLITNESIRCFLEDDDGTVLLGTLYEGVLRYDPVSGKISKAFNGFLSKGLILCLYRDSQRRLWVGTFLDGFYCIDGKSTKIYNQSVFREKDFTNQNMSRAIYEDPNGRYWVSVANQGVGELDIKTGKIIMLRDKHPEIGFHRKNFGFYPVNDDVFATFGESGIYYYDTQKDRVFIPEMDDPYNHKFANPNISYNCVMKDSRSLEWFGTEQGIRIWDEQNKKAYTIDIKNGLTNNTVVSMKEDNYGVVWAATSNGITKIEIRESVHEYEFSLVHFDTHDGLQNGKFFEQSALKTKNGDLYFGGYNGFNTFNPDKIHYNQSEKKPVLTALRLFNSLIDENTDYKGRKILKKSINNTKEIKLNYNENFVTFEFSGLN